MSYGYDSYDNHNVRPISAWGYVLWQILFAIPVLGWLILLITALCARNLVLRSFARSYFCVLLLVVILTALVVGLAFAGIFNVTDYLRTLIDLLPTV